LSRPFEYIEKLWLERDGITETVADLLYVFGGSSTSTEALLSWSKGGYFNIKSESETNPDGIATTLPVETL
jgi:hypothetical protein